MDEIAKTEARNYLCAAGFFLIAAHFILVIFSNIRSNIFIEPNNYLHIAIGIGLLIIATLLIILRKRDMIAILFVMIGFVQLFWSFVSPGTWGFILVGFMLLVALVTLTSKEKVKWLLFIIPAIMFVEVLLRLYIGYNPTVFIVILMISAVLSLYYAFCCACERYNLPGSKLLTADESTDFKSSGSVLGYMLFALITGGYALYYILGEAVLPIESFVTMEILCGSLMIFIAILLLAVGKMRFTPIMFLLMGLTGILSIIILHMGLTGILSMYSASYMFIGIGILWVVVSLFAMLRKESRILPGIMMIVYGCTMFFSVYANFAMISAPVVSVILNAIPCLIAIYLAFVVYSQRKLPKF